MKTNNINIQDVDYVMIDRPLDFVSIHYKNGDMAFYGMDDFNQKVWSQLLKKEKTEDQLEWEEIQ